MKRLITLLFGVHFHDWTPWRKHDGWVGGSGLYVMSQERTCKSCGFMEIEAI